MVKILEQSEREKKNEKKYKDLVQLTRENLKWFKAYEVMEVSGLSFAIRYKDSLSTVVLAFSDINQINVYDQKYEREAIRLAELYEKKTGEEFTVKKSYS